MDHSPNPYCIFSWSFLFSRVVESRKSNGSNRCVHTSRGKELSICFAGLNCADRRTRIHRVDPVGQFERSRRILITDPQADFGLNLLNPTCEFLNFLDDPDVAGSEGRVVEFLPPSPFAFALPCPYFMLPHPFVS